jgi:hypothetical protein
MLRIAKLQNQTSYRRRGGRGDLLIFAGSKYMRESSIYMIEEAQQIPKDYLGS